MSGHCGHRVTDFPRSMPSFHRRIHRENRRVINRPVIPIKMHARVRRIALAIEHSQRTASFRLENRRVAIRVAERVTARSEAETKASAMTADNFRAANAADNETLAVSLHYFMLAIIDMFIFPCRRSLICVRVRFANSSEYRASERARNYIASGSKRDDEEGTHKRARRNVV